jgi:hypothetical protein
MIKRRKDLEADLPRSFRRCGDKPRVYEDARGELFIVVGGKRRSEADIERIAEDGLALQRASALLMMPAAGGLQ